MAAKAFLFDYGGVFTASPFRAIDELGVKIGAAPGQAVEIIFGPYASDTDHPWHRLERGEITLQEAREAILALGQKVELETDVFQFFAAMSTGAGVREEFVDLVREIRAAGHKTGMITNNVLEFREHWEKTLPLVELFDVVIDSSAVGVRKPDPAIFTLTMEHLGVQAEQSVFIDDFEGNIDAAQRLGLQGVLVEEDFAPSIAETRRLLG
jgi:epoxide hydrolase-like predicted phosphatase